MKSSEDIIAKIKRKDHALRVMLVILALVIVAAQSLVIALVWVTNDRLNQTIQQISQENQQSQLAMDKQLQQIQRQHRDQDTYLTCITEQLSKSRKITACPEPFNTPIEASAPSPSQESSSGSATNGPTSNQTPAPTPAATAPPNQSSGLPKQIQNFINSIIPGAH
jgi:flagellum-specific peptidoglycan hydrolase FlgJ